MLANLFFVGHLHWPKPAAYALVVWLQMTCGFMMCRYIVFMDGRAVSLVRAYAQYLASMSAIRLADWCLYTIAVEVFSFPYLTAQIAMAALFIGIKFILAKSIFIRKQTEKGDKY